MNREIVVTMCDLGYGHNTNWVIVREDDSRFEGLAAKYPGQVRPIRDPSAYEGATSYDFEGVGL